MDTSGLLELAFFLLVLTVLVKPVGGYLQRVFARERTLLDTVLLPAERLIYKLCGVNTAEQMDAKTYALAFILFSFVGTLVLYCLLRLQSFFPWYDKSLITSPLTPDLAFNTAISFVTTSTWQAYGGETTMSYWTQLVGLTGQNFLAGASGLAIGIAFIRGLSTKCTFDRLGNFWVDIVRSLLWVLLPSSLIGSIVLIWQGVPMNFLPAVHAATVEGAVQIIPQGPVAAMEWIKNLGTNGGGFFNANGAHPYENPTPLTNLLEMLAIAVLPAALTDTFGRMVGNVRQGRVLFVVMTLLFVAGYVATAIPEQAGNRAAMAAAGTIPKGGNLEGKEQRFGIGGSVLTATVTSNCATGSTNSTPDSYMPLSGMVLLINMLLGEIVYGGLGTGLYSIVMLAFIAVFVAGQMIGRTPEYLGRKVGASEMKIVLLFTLASPLAILLPTALAIVLPAGLAGLTTNSGPHAFTEVLYAYTSSFANNGQSFGGLSANSPFYNITTAFAMILGRFALAIPALILAGRFSRSTPRPASLGTLSTDTALFATLIAGVALLVVGLGYLPALALGPIVEHLMPVK